MQSILHALERIEALLAADTRTYMSLPQVAGYLGVHKDTVYRWIEDPVKRFPKARYLPSVGAGKKTMRRWRRVDIDRWLDTLWG